MFHIGVLGPNVLYGEIHSIFFSCQSREEQDCHIPLSEGIQLAEHFLG